MAWRCCHTSQRNSVLQHGPEPGTEQVLLLRRIWPAELRNPERPVTADSNHPATVGGVTLWKDKQVIDIYNDILALYADLIARNQRRSR